MYRCVCVCLCCYECINCQFPLCMPLTRLQHLGDGLLLTAAPLKSRAGLERVSSVSLAVRFVSLMLSLLLPIFVQYNFTIRAMGSHNCHAPCPMPSPSVPCDDRDCCNWFSGSGFLVLRSELSSVCFPSFNKHTERERGNARREREIG